jgi:hypothetical protein
MLEEEARKRMSAGGRGDKSVTPSKSREEAKKRQRGGQGGLLMEKFPQASKGLASEKAGKMFLRFINLIFPGIYL